MSLDEARKFFEERGAAYKLELLDDIVDRAETISCYQDGEFVDLCRGPHMRSTGEIKHFKLLDVAGAYWRGDETKQMLQRIYGTAFRTKEDLDHHLWKLEEAKNYVEKALELDPEFVEAYNNLGNIQKAHGNLKDAKVCYDKALHIDPNNADVRYNIALMHLFSGDLREGWEAYDWRWRVKGVGQRNFPFPLWDGTSLKEKTLEYLNTH